MMLSLPNYCAPMLSLSFLRTDCRPCSACCVGPYGLAWAAPVGNRHTESRALMSIICAPHPTLFRDNMRAVTC